MYNSDFSFASVLGEEPLLIEQLFGKPILCTYKENCQLLKYSFETFELEAGVKNNIIVSLTVKGHFSGVHHAIEFIGISPSSLSLINKNPSLLFYANNDTNDRVYIKKEKGYVSMISILGHMSDRQARHEETYQLQDEMSMKAKDKVRLITLDSFLKTLIDLYSTKTARDTLSSLKLINKYGFRFQNQDTVNMLVDYVQSCAQRIFRSSQ